MLNSANIFLGRGWGESLGYPFNAVVHFQKPRSERKKIAVAREREKKKILSEVGFEPTPTYVDQNASNSHLRVRNLSLSLAP